MGKEEGEATGRHCDNSSFHFDASLFICVSFSVCSFSSPFKETNMDGISYYLFVFSNVCSL